MAREKKKATLDQQELPDMFGQMSRKAPRRSSAKRKSSVVEGTDNEDANSADEFFHSSNKRSHDSDGKNSGPARSTSGRPRKRSAHTPAPVTGPAPRRVVAATQGRLADIANVSSARASVDQSTTLEDIIARLCGGMQYAKRAAFLLTHMNSLLHRRNESWITFTICNGEIRYHIPSRTIVVAGIVRLLVSLKHSYDTGKAGLYKSELK
ncbi:hypothetical protein N0V95_007355 [Ascochyta clinopodiicola]|nr:hypothetical protein N0V95_007355 [Ascochyta clinopodiicola]